MTKTIADLMNGHQSAEIICPVRNVVVRRLVVCDKTLEIDASGPWGREEYAAALDTEIRLQPMFMDRGNVVLSINEQLIKFCTEADQIRFEDGSISWVEV